MCVSCESVGGNELPRDESLHFLKKHLQACCRDSLVSFAHAASGQEQQNVVECFAFARHCRHPLLVVAEIVVQMQAGLRYLLRPCFFSFD